jgi:hypothetical protein
MQLPSPSSRARTLAIFGCVGLVLVVYVRCAWSYNKDLNPAPRRTDFHNLVADALVHRQTELRIKPPRGLLQLKDPYNPVANAIYRKQGIHDLSLYKGKLYAYYGPAPAILLFTPFRLLRVGDLSPTLAGLVFCSLGFGFSVLLFLKLVRRFLGDVPVWMHCMAILALGLAVPAPFIVNIGRAYEVSIASGYLLLFAGLYSLVSGLLSQGKTSLILLAIGSGTLAAGVAARPDLVFAAAFVGVAVTVIIVRSREAPSQARRGQFLAVVVPYLIVGVLIAAYNFARFGSLTEFGASYQLAGANIRTYPFYQLWYIPHGLYYYLLAPGRLLGKYPYWFLLKDVPYVDSSDVYTHEPVAGVLVNMPLITLGLLLTATQMKKIFRTCRPIFIAISAGLAVAGGLLLAVSITFRAATMRYELDFAPLLLICGLLGWAFWSLRSRSRGAQFWALQAIWVIALITSFLFNFAITLTPCQGTGSC